MDGGIMRQNYVLYSDTAQPTLARSGVEVLHFTYANSNYL